MRTSPLFLHSHEVAPVQEGMQTQVRRGENTVSLDDVRAGKLRDAGHLNYGRRGGGTLWKHTTILRLSAVDRPTLSDAEAAEHGATRIRVWNVDGLPVGSLESAIAALALPPVLSLGEFVVLARLPAEFDWLRAVQARIAGITEAEAPTTINDHPRYCAVTNAIMQLREIGLVELQPRPVERRSEFGPRTMPMIRRSPEIPIPVPAEDAVGRDALSTEEAGHGR